MAQLHYDIYQGVRKAKTKFAIAFTSLGLILGGGGLSLAIFGTAHAILPAPTLLSPANNAVVNGSTLTSVWSAVPGAAYYKYTSFSGTNCTAPIRYTNNYTSTSKTATSVANATFWWHVTAYDSGNSAGDTSSCWKVTIDNTDLCLAVYTSKGALTTRQIGSDVTGDLNALGCDIGVYYDSSSGNVGDNATIHDANQYGVFVDGITGNASVDVTDSSVYNIGNHTGGVFDPNGVQTGVGIYYYGLGTTGTVDGTIDGNTVEQYQKGGVVVNGEKASAGITGNTVTGFGPIDFIAQNGIQVSRGATATTTAFADNTVSGNIYTQNGSCAPGCVGSSVGVVSTGVLFFDAGVTPKTGTIASNNHVFQNQANVTIIK